MNQVIRTSSPLPKGKSYFLCLSSVSHYRPDCLLLRWRLHSLLLLLLLSLLSSSSHSLFFHGIKSLAFVHQSHRIKFSVTPPHLFSHKYIVLFAYSRSKIINNGFSRPQRPCYLSPLYLQHLSGGFPQQRCAAGPYAHRLAVCSPRTL